MGQILKQSQTAEPLIFLMVDSTDHFTGKTGLSPTVKLSKNGGTGVSPSGAITEIDSTNLPGLYKVAGNATDTNTLGPLVIEASATGADHSTTVAQVVAYDPEAAGVVVTTNNDKTGYTASTVSDKTGYSLAAADSPNMQSGTAQAGAAATITLASGASATDNLYVGELVKITSGTGVGQVRTISGYVGSTKVATVSRNWVTNPDNTSVYAVIADQAPKIDTSLQTTAASVQGNVTGSVGSLTTNNDKTGYTASTVSDKTGYSLAADQAVNVTKVNGTSQTARDLGASVLISPGTGTGQLDVTSGVIKANLAQILGTALTETAGLIAAGFKKFFNIASPTSTMNEITLVDTSTALTTNNDKTGYSLAASQHVIADSLTTNNDKTGYALAASQHVIADSLTTNNDKTGYALTALESMVLQSGTASAGGASTITLAGASATDSFYNGELVKVYGGTGAGQTRVITGYVGSTKVATVDHAWATNPDNTSLFAVLASDEAKKDSSLQVTAASVQGNVTGSVGSVTGNVGGNVVGSVGSLTGYVAPDNTDIATILTRTDVATSTRLATSGYTSPDNTSITAIKAKTDNLPASPAAVSDIPTAAAISDEVWEEAMADHLTSGTTGASLNGAGAAGDPWATSLPGSYGAGTAGKIVGTNLDATVSSRNATTPPTVTAIRSEMDTNSTKLAHLDADVSSRNATVPPTVAAIRTEMDANSTKLANLDTNVGSRLATSGYTAPDNTDIATILTRTDVATSTRLATSGYTVPPTTAAIADEVWDEPGVDHTTAGTMGQELNTVGAATDPLSNPVPGSYSPGSAGYDIAAMKTKLDALNVSTAITIAVPVDPVTGNATIVRGDAYKAGAAKGPLVWTETTGLWLPYAGLTSVFTAKSTDGKATVSAPATVAHVSGNTCTITVELNSDDTEAITNKQIAAGDFSFDVQSLITTDTVDTPLSGALTVLQDVSPPPD